MSIRILSAFLLTISTLFIPVLSAFAQSDNLYDDSGMTMQEAAEYYSEEYDSIYDNSSVQDEEIHPETTFAVPESSYQTEELQPETSASEPQTLPTETIIERQENSTGKRKHHPKFYLSAGANASFHFDSFLGTESSYTNIFGGINGSIRFGLLGSDFSWSIEQTFGHIWGLRIDSGSKEMTRYDASTFIEINMFTPLKHHFEVFSTIGAGFLYNMPHSVETAAYGDYLAVDKHGTNLAVGIKLSAAINYFFTDNFGLGFELAYILGIDIGSYMQGEFADRNGNYTHEDKLLTEILQPGILCFFKF